MTGWTSYAPLGPNRLQAAAGQTLLHTACIRGRVVDRGRTLNFWVTIITMLAPGLTFWRCAAVWANFNTSICRV